LRWTNSSLALPFKEYLHARRVSYSRIPTLFRLDQTNRSDVLPPPASEVIHKSQKANNRKHDDSPIEVCQCSRICCKRIRRPEREEKCDGQKDKRDVIDDTSPFSQRPFVRHEDMSANVSNVLRGFLLRTYQRRGRSGSPRSRRRRRAPIEMKYESRSAALLTERMAPKTTSLPKLIVARISHTPRQTSSELTGTSQPGTT